MNPQHPTPDDIDRAFSQYFRAQVPARWPAPPVPVDVPQARAAGPWRARLTLGGSIAALLAVGLAVSYGPSVGQPNQPGRGFDKTGTANGEKMLERMADIPPMGMMP